MNTRKALSFALTFILVSVIGVTPVCFASQESGEKTTIKEVKKEVADAAQVIKEYSAEQKDEAVKKAKAAMDDLDARIDAIETRVDNEWGEMSQTARQQARESLKTLRKKRNEVAEWYGALKHSSSDAWDEIKKGFTHAYQALVEEWEESEKEMNPGQ